MALARFSVIAREIAEEGDIVVILRLRKVSPQHTSITIGSSIDLADQKNDDLLRHGLEVLRTGRPAPIFKRE